MGAGSGTFRSGPHLSLPLPFPSEPLNTRQFAGNSQAILGGRGWKLGLWQAWQLFLQSLVLTNARLAQQALKGSVPS